MGETVKVAVIDTGIDYNHLDLKGNYAGGYDFGDGDANPMDTYGHGTRVSGDIGAIDNDIGVIGVAPMAELYALKVRDKRGSSHIRYIVAALEWCVDNDMQVANMSFGWEGRGYKAIEAACQNAYRAGVLLVAAAGNWSGSVGYPAAYPCVIAVSATDEDDNLASFSCFGEEIELAAPGVNVTSPTIGGGYDTKSGTSHAAPHVAGVAALVFAANPGWGNEQVREHLKATAMDLGEPGFDIHFGHGLVSARNAVPPTEGYRDIALDDISAPSPVMIGDLVPVDVTVTNTGTYSEICDVSLTDMTDEVDIGKQTGVTLAEGSSDVLGFSWDTAVSSPGTHSLKAEATSVDEETYVSNNYRSIAVDVQGAAHDVAITDIMAPSSATQGDIVPVAVDAANEGDSQENFTVTLTDTTDGGLIGSQSVTLSAGLSTSLNFDWDTGTASVGDHVLKAEASIVPGEADTEDNSKASIVSIVESGATMHVADIAMSLKYAGRWVNAVATVTIVDDSGFPVAGPTVYGRWSGRTTDTDSGKTNGVGKVSLSSDRVRKASATFTFTVDHVVLTGWAYDPEANVETSDEITSK